MVQLDIDGGGFDWAAQALSTGNQLAARYYATLTGKLNGYGSMAGDDSTSQEFSTEYDVAAKEGVDAINDLVDSFATLAILTATSIENHRAANANSVYNKPVPVWDGKSGLPAEGPVDVQPFTPPSSLGGNSSDTPDFWDEVVAHLEGFAWPNADTGKLREAAGAWRDAADSVGRLTTYPERAVGLFSGQKSPEIPVATEALNEFKTQITDLADSLRSIGQSCDDYATQVEEHRDVIRDILRDMAIEAGISIVAGAIVGFFSFGGGAAAGGAIAGWRIVSAARKVLKALRALKAVAKAGAVAKLTSVVSKVKPLRAILGKFKNAKKLDNAADATTAGRALTQAEKEALEYATRPDKLDHVFVPKHKFDDLLAKYGSREKAMEEIVKSLGPMKDGVFEVQRMVGGQMVTIRGNVINGVPKIGTAFIP